MIVTMKHFETSGIMLGKPIRRCKNGGIRLAAYDKQGNQVGECYLCATEVRYITSKTDVRRIS